MSLSPDPSYINCVATFLACEQITDLSTCQPVDCIVLCVSAIFHCAETVFNALRARPNLSKTLVICGGVGHSTPFLYDAVAKDPRYQSLDVRGLPEARVLYMIFQRYYDGVAIVKAGCKVLVEDKSTNCGANAIETFKILKMEGDLIPESIIVVQDPTMSRRTVASFEKAFQNLQPPPKIYSCPTFVPQMQKVDGNLVFSNSPESVNSDGLWDRERFYSLLMGEIPRLRDDHDGYGPRGKNFIVHVDIPEDVDEAFRHLGMGSKRAAAES